MTTEHPAREDAQPAVARIVVGFDASPGAVAALHWAVAEAALRSARVEVVYAWQYPGLAFPEDPRPPAPDALPADVAEGLREAFAPAATPPLGCRTVEGHPGSGLVQAAAGAELLVLGVRRHHLLGAMAVGSVSQHCAAHAPCPVVLVRPPDRAGGPG